MTTQYLIKYITATGKYTWVDPASDIFSFVGIRLGGVLFDQTNIVTVSGVNSLTSSLASVSGVLQSHIDAVSGASSHRDDTQDATVAALTATLVSVSGTLQSEIATTSGFLQTEMATVSGYLQAEMVSVSGTLQAEIVSVSSFLQTEMATVSGTLQSTIGTVSSFLQAEMVSVSGTLQSEINGILNDRAKEERFEAVSGQVLFTLSTIVFDPSPSVHDLQVFKNGLKAFQSLTGILAGVSGGDFVKVGTNQVQWLYGLRDGDRVIVRDERTGAGSGGGGGSVDLTNVASDIIPDANNVRTLGSGTKTWKSLYLQDTVRSDWQWQLEIVSGAITAVLVGS